MPFIEKPGLYMYIPTTLSKTPKRLWMFDVDGTILTASDGSPIAGADFQLLGDVPEVFNDLMDGSTVIAFVSNQMYWTNPKYEAKEKFKRLRILFPTVMQVVAVGKDSPYRKPSPEVAEEIYRTLGTKPTEIHYVGDAVGPEDPFPPYRWASSDREFAEAIGAKFHRPLELFPHTPLPVPITGQELIITVGNQGSGKSTLSEIFKKEPNYVVVSQDEVGTKSKVISLAKAAWADGKSVFIDATNPPQSKRIELIQSITQGTAKPSVRILWNIRDGRPFNSLRKEPIPEIGYRMYTKYFVRPTVEELLEAGAGPHSSVEILY